MNTGALLARRAHYIATSFWFLLIVVGVALMGAQFSGHQPATVALDVGISAMRILLPLLIILLVQELLSREFDRRYILASITYPRPRHWLLLGRISTVLLLIYVAQIIIASALALAVSQISQGYEQTTPIDLGLGYWITMGHMSVDLLVLTAMAALLAVVASTPSFVLIGTLGFMIIARSYSVIIALLERERYLFDGTELYKQSLGIMNFLLPDLAALDVRLISLYNRPELIPKDWLATLTACLAYAVVLIVVTLLFFRSKRLN
jgi:ABC-type transport system involved in multi-copper enzyme maturation permease subunit